MGMFDDIEGWLGNNWKKHDHSDHDHEDQPVRKTTQHLPKSKEEELLKDYVEGTLNDVPAHVRNEIKDSLEGLKQNKLKDPPKIYIRKPGVTGKPNVMLHAELDDGESTEKVIQSLESADSLRSKEKEDDLDLVRVLSGVIRDFTRKFEYIFEVIDELTVKAKLKPQLHDSEGKELVVGDILIFKDGSEKAVLSMGYKYAMLSVAGELDKQDWIWTQKDIDHAKLKKK